VHLRASVHFLTCVVRNNIFTVYIEDWSAYSLQVTYPPFFDPARRSIRPTTLGWLQIRTATPTTTIRSLGCTRRTIWMEATCNRMYTHHHKWCVLMCGLCLRVWMCGCVCVRARARACLKVCVCSVWHLKIYNSCLLQNWRTNLQVLGWCLATRGLKRTLYDFLEHIEVSNDARPRLFFSLLDS
jgi:hypothetical protein